MLLLFYQEATNNRERVLACADCGWAMAHLSIVILCEIWDVAVAGYRKSSCAHQSSARR